jgi:hypothetical protein
MKSPIMLWSDEDFAKAGLDRERTVSLARKLMACSRELESLGLKVYGCAGSGLLIHHSRPTHPTGNGGDQGAVIADLGQGFDGGDW